MRLVRELAIEVLPETLVKDADGCVVSNWRLNHCGPESSEYFGNPRHRHARRFAFSGQRTPRRATREKVEPGPLPVGRTIGFALGIVRDERVAPLNQDWKSVFA